MPDKFKARVPRFFIAGVPDVANTARGANYPSIGSPRLLQVRVAQETKSAARYSGDYMGVSENEGTLFWGPYNKVPTIWGTILGSPIFGNPHMH